MEKTNTTFNLELNGRSGREGLYEVYLRITQNRKHKRIKLIGISVKKADFNRKAKYGKWIRTKNPDHKKLNDSLKSEIKKAEDNFKELEKKKQSLSLYSIKQKIINPNSQSFYDYARKEYEYYKTSTKYSYSFVKHFNSIIFNKMKTFTDLKGLPDLLFSDLTLGFLKEYESYLTKLGNKTNTIHKNMGFIKALINDAIEESLIKPEDSPFLHYKLKKTSVNKDKLSREEIQKIEELALPGGTLIDHSRNMFLFSFYMAGIRASDCIKLQWRNVIEGRLIYYMDKNEKPVNLKIGTKAEDILSRYRKPDSKPNDFIFPLLDSRRDFSDRIILFNQVSSKNALINKYLRKIAKHDDVKIEKKLSFHISRHSFASLAKNEMGISTDKISELLNHSSPSVTKAYLRGFENTEMDSALELINSGGTIKTENHE
jgi:integrase/recombinase XerD